jgi:hypothetical protein
LGLLVACSSRTETTEPPPRTANGTIGAWENVETLPVARANHCAVVANGHIVVIGGSYKPKGATAFVELADVHVAKINEDGSLGPWSLAGATKSSVSTCTAASEGKDVYVVDGLYKDETLGGHVMRATLTDAGKLSEWQDLGTMPMGVRVVGGTASVEKGVLRVVRARLGAVDPQSGAITDPGAVTVLAAPVAGNALGAWEETPWLGAFRGYPQLVFGKGFVYALGGYAFKTTEVLADGAGAAIDERGKPGASFAVAPLPKPTTSGRAAYVDGWIFVTGGKDKALGPGSEGRTDVFAAKVADDGTIGEWKTLHAMPAGRTNHAVVVSGEFLYVVGGGFDAGGLDSVYATRVRF